jgi:hypothetical protein
MRQLASEPGGFRERPYLFPGPARGRVQQVVRDIAALDHMLSVISKEEEPSL